MTDAPSASPAASKKTVTLRVDTYDVFADAAFRGNQLAVFSGASLPDVPSGVLQALAKEMNYAESTFVFSPSHHDDDASGKKPHEEEVRARFRIFTSDKELDFAGHPTLGTARHLLDARAASHDNNDNNTDDATMPTPEVVLECRAGVVRVRRDDKTPSLLWMRQLPPTIRADAPVPLEVVASGLGCAEAALEDLDRFPPLVVSTGTPFLIVALRSVDALRRLRHAGGALSALCASRGVVGVYCVARGGRDATHSVSARSLVDESAVPEDPATGSACGCFAGWALHTRFLGPSPLLDVVVGQGHEIARPSLLHLRARATGELKGTQFDDASIEVGGGVVPMLRGATLTVPLS